MKREMDIFDKTVPVLIGIMILISLSGAVGFVTFVVKALLVP